MSTAVFPVAFLRPPAADYFETMTWQGVNERSEGGYFAALNTAADPLFRCRGKIRLPQGDSTYGTLQDFIDAREGTVDTFLYRPVIARNRVFTSQALGTGTGSATAFPFASGTNLHRHIVNGDHSDEVTLKVYKAGVLQTLTTHYTVSGNDSAPVVTFVSAPGLGEAITLDYEIYVPMRFVSISEPMVLSRKKSDGIDFEEVVEVDAALEEDRPGRRFAA